jgi:MoxR-like ATPase
MTDRAPNGSPAARIAPAASEILDEVERAVVGKRPVLALVLAGLLADGHVLLEDLPGLAKTLLARSFATTLGLELHRIQFTPDLLPSDVTGSPILDPATRTLVFQPGPVFANLVLGDEINRAPPKTQSALLEAMQERQVTVEGVTHVLPRPFLVLATQNPIEYEGTYPLPEAQLDRFLLRVSLGYPDPHEEVEILRRRVERGHDEPELRPIVDAERFRAMQAALEGVHVDPALLEYVVRIVDATRSHPSLLTGASPRGSLGLLKAARALAAVAGRDYVTPDDVKTVAPAVLSHRLILRPELWVQGTTTTDVVGQCLAHVATPDPRATAAAAHAAAGGGAPAAPGPPPGTTPPPPG